MKMYQVVEQGKGIRETYMWMAADDKEMAAYLNGKIEANGYIPGLGGDKNYSIVAWSIRKDGAGYIDLEKYWRHNEIHKKIA